MLRAIEYARLHDVPYLASFETNRGNRGLERGAIGGNQPTFARAGGDLDCLAASAETTSCPDQ